MSNKLTTEEFVSQVKNIYGDKYDYSKIEFNKLRSPVCVTCKQHGDFWIRALSLLNGVSCPHCRDTSKSINWTRVSCTEEAKKYKSIKDFREGSIGAYGYALNNGLLDSFDWLKYKKKPNGYWTYERCRDSALKYKTKKDFLENDRSAHSASTIHGWLKTFDWLTDDRITSSDKIDSVYVYVFDTLNAAYIGRALMRRQKKRDNEHLFNEADAVARFAKEHDCPVPSMHILEENLTLEEGLKQEDFWRNEYLQQGYTILNKAATGVGKGSLCGLNSGKWNRKSCYQEALKYVYLTDFERESNSACCAARRNGWIKEYDWLINRAAKEWTREECYAEARKYITPSSFEAGCRGAYVKALKCGWFQDYTWMTRRQQKPKGYWNNYNNCYEEAKKYKSIRQLQLGCPSAYLSAKKNGWIDDYTWFTRRNKPQGYWTKETCYQEAQKYKKITDFARKAVRAYTLSKENGWMTDYKWFYN